SLQFDLPHTAPPPVKPLIDLSGLFRAIGHALEFAAPALKIVFWGGVALAALFVVVFVARAVLGLRLPGRRRSAGRVPAAEWRPDRTRARVLLEDADRLAGEGRFAEAAHLLLLRGVQDIQSHRPRAVAPALTSRDIAASPDLPDPVRPAFA